MLPVDKEGHHVLSTELTSYFACVTVLVLTVTLKGWGCCPNFTDEEILQELVSDGASEW